MKFNYMTEKCELPAYYQFPEFLLNMNLSQTARIIYMLLYDRSRLSLKNKWLDKAGHAYIIFPLKEIARASDRSESAVKIALSDLEDAGLLRRVSGGFSKPNHIYVRIPDSSEADGTRVTKRAFIRADNNPCNGQKTDHTTGRFQTPNKVIETSNKNKDTGIRMSFPDYTCEEGESL